MFEGFIPNYSCLLHARDLEGNIIEIHFFVVQYMHNHGGGAGFTMTTTYYYAGFVFAVFINIFRK